MIGFFKNGYPEASVNFFIERINEDVDMRFRVLSPVPGARQSFFAKVHFPDGLLTSYGHEIPPRNGMTGQAEIITQDVRLLERVYNNITKELR